MVFKVLVLPLASRLHGVEYYGRLYRELVDALNSYNGVEVHDIVTDEPPAIDYSGYDTIAIVHLTGGTSRFAKEIASTSNKPVVLIGHSRHNSIASLLSARAWLWSRGYSVKSLYVDRISDLGEAFKPVYKGLYTRYRLSNMKVLEVNESGETSGSAKLFSSRIGCSVETVSYEVIREYGWSVEESVVDELYKRFSRSIDFSGVDRDSLYNVLRVYAGLKKIVEEKGVDAVSIDCFPFVVKYRVTPCLAVAMLNNEGIPCACENDFYSLLIQFIGYGLTGYPGWIANPSGLTSEGYLRLAHCTVAPMCCLNPYLVPHFETGYPYAVACRLLWREVAILRISLDYREVHLYHGVNKASGLLDPGFCRTQLVVELTGCSGREFIENAIGNHHVVLPYSGLFIESLETLCWRMGWRLVVHGG